MFFLVLTGSAVTAGSNESKLTFQIRSEYEYKVQIAFFSQDRDHQWPGGDQAYSLDDSEVHSFPLKCKRGETICYGAWVTGNDDLYWGAGFEGQHACDDCCYVCDGGTTPVRVLQN
jgi:hypothetical protein